MAFALNCPGEVYGFSRGICVRLSRSEGGAPSMRCRVKANEVLRQLNMLRNEFSADKSKNVCEDEPIEGAELAPTEIDCEKNPCTSWKIAYGTRIVCGLNAVCKYLVQKWLNVLALKDVSNLMFL